MQPFSFIPSYRGEGCSGVVVGAQQQRHQQALPMTAASGALVTATGLAVEASTQLLLLQLQD